MTTEEFSRMVAAAQDGDTKPFDAFFRTFSRECKGRLYAFVSSRQEAEEAFSEAMYEFWKAFVIEKKVLPKSNVKGYIFTMAKFYCLDKQKERRKKQTDSVDDVEGRVKKNDGLVLEDRTKEDFLAEQSLEERYQVALRSAIGKLKEKCRKLFDFILQNGLDKPRDLWEPLGYKNAGTMRTVKADCHRILKLKVVVEMQSLSRRDRD